MCTLRASSAFAALSPEDKVPADFDLPSVVYQLLGRVGKRPCLVEGLDGRLIEIPSARLLKQLNARDLAHCVERDDSFGGVLAVGGEHSPAIVHPHDLVFEDGSPRSVQLFANALKVRKEHKLARVQCRLLTLSEPFDKLLFDSTIGLLKFCKIGRILTLQNAFLRRLEEIKPKLAQRPGLRTGLGKVRRSFLLGFGHGLLLDDPIFFSEKSLVGSLIDFFAGCGIDNLLFFFELRQFDDKGFSRPLHFAALHPLLGKHQKQCKEQMPKERPQHRFRHGARTDSNANFPTNVHGCPETPDIRISVLLKGLFKKLTLRIHRLSSVFFPFSGLGASNKRLEAGIGVFCRAELA